MPKLLVTRADGTAIEVDAEPGKSLMVALRDDGGPGVVDEQFGLCGGCCTCYTCHVRVDPEFLAALPAMSAQEDDLLTLAHYREANSRLSCQIPLTDALDGLRLTLPPVD